MKTTCTIKAGDSTWTPDGPGRGVEPKECGNV